MVFSKKIDKLLKENDIKNIRQLAKECDIPYTTLWDYYTNPVRLEKANLTYIKKIAKRLNCSVDYLAFDDVEYKNLSDEYDIAFKDASPIIRTESKILNSIDKNTSYDLGLENDYILEPDEGIEVEINSLDDLPKSELNIFFDTLHEIGVLNYDNDINQKELDVIIEFIENNKKMLKQLIDEQKEKEYQEFMAKINQKDHRKDN